MNLSQVSGRLADVGVLAFFGLLIWSHPQLPERVVSHFGANGPDGWMTKNVFVTVFAGAVIFLEIVFRWWMPKMLRRPVPRLVNTPHRGYWMATPERRAEASAKTLQVIGPSRLFMIGIMLLALHACVQASGVPVFVQLPLQLLGFVIGGGTLLYSAAMFVWASRAFKPPVERRV